MKKIIGALIGIILFSNIQAFASDIEVQATMFSRTNAQDRVWVGTFQLVWNDFIDKVVHNSIRFREGTPVFVQELNYKSFTTDDISENCYLGLNASWRSCGHVQNSYIEVTQWGIDLLAYKSFFKDRCIAQLHINDLFNTKKNKIINKVVN